MGERRGAYRVLVEKRLEDTSVDGRIILRWIFRKWDVGVWTGSSWLKTGTVRALVNVVMKLRFP
jgi:hypothetical protein